MLNGRLYVIGGEGEDCKNKVQVLERSEENGFSWTVKTDLPAVYFPRYAAASAVHEGKIWVIGGIVNADHDPDPEFSVIIYDPELDSWATGPSPPFRPVITCGGCATHDGEIHLSTCDGMAVFRGGMWHAIEQGDEGGVRGVHFHASQSLLMG